MVSRGLLQVVLRPCHRGRYLFHEDEAVFQCPCGSSPSIYHSRDIWRPGQLLLAYPANVRPVRHGKRGQISLKSTTDRVNIFDFSCSFYITPVTCQQQFSLEKDAISPIPTAPPPTITTLLAFLNLLRHSSINSLYSVSSSGKSTKPSHNDPVAITTTS
jgi:hypothetical protein